MPAAARRPAAVRVVLELDCCAAAAPVATYSVSPDTLAGTLRRQLACVISFRMGNTELSDNRSLAYYGIRDGTHRLTILRACGRILE